MVANDFIQCRKVAEHILEKLLGEGTAGSPGAGDTDPTSPTNNGTSVDQIELTCNDQVSLIHKNYRLSWFKKQFLGIRSFDGFKNCKTFHMEVICRFNFIL